jgi:phosphate transport system permease protein
MSSSRWWRSWLRSPAWFWDSSASSGWGRCCEIRSTCPRGCAALPTIISISEDALTGVPRTYREAAYGLGATRWQTLWRITLPSASSGILAAVMLGIGRVVGETMVVLMVTGNAPVMPKSILQPLRTLTATIAGEMGETVGGSEQYYALFAVGLVLFAITFSINLVADLFLRRARK